MFRSSFARQASKLRAPSRTFASLSASANASPSSVSSSLPHSVIASPFPSSSIGLRSLKNRPLQSRGATVLSRWNSTDSSSKSEEQPPEKQNGTENPKPEQQTTATAEEAGAKAAAPATDKAGSELEVKQKEIIELKDKYLRSVADYRNLQERTRREVQQSKDFAIQRLAKDLLESIDNLDMALINVPKEALSDKEGNKELVNLFDGLKMTEKVLLTTLEKHGLVRFDPVGEKFNPHMHEATFEVEMQNKEPGSVFHVQSKGFSLNGRVLRAARVGVVKPPASPSQPSEASPAS